MQWLKNTIKKIRPKTTSENTQLRKIPREEHGISRKQISQGALAIMKKLQSANFQAYLVGGGVRDLLLGGRPKDFDIATDARPEQVHALFKGSRIVGRRFRIVHVRHGREMIEVTTFRGGHDDDESKGKNNQHGKRNATGMLVRDNIYGNMHEDAERRDFTVNALYYCSLDRCLYDYTNGLDDIHQRQLRLIGEPETRYREDPVRMLRAARFAAKLEFDLAEDTASPIPKLANLLQNVSSARLYDEMLKLFQAGYAEETCLQLQRYGLFEQLFPGTHYTLNHDTHSEQYETLILEALRNTDKRLRDGKSVTPAFIIAALLWPPLNAARQRLEHHGSHPQQAMQDAANQVIGEQLTRIAIPKRFTINVREIWDMQLRLPNTGGKRAERTASHPRFRAAYDFLLLREKSGEQLDGLGAWWTDYQLHNEITVDTTLEKKPHRRPRRRQRNVH